MLEMIKNWVLKLFGKKLRQSESISNENSKFDKDYKDISDINFTSIFAKRIAGMAVSDSSVSVTGNSKRAKVLDTLIQEVWDEIQSIVTVALGTGGVAIVPFFSNGNIYFSEVAQNRVYVNSVQGKKITEAVICSDYTVKDNRRYVRLSSYTVENGGVTIKNRALCEGSPCSPESVPEWAGIETEIVIPGMDRVPFAFLRSPQDKRGKEGYSGVPITYGSEKIIKDVYECLRQIEREYELKKPFVGADETMFKPDKSGKAQLPSNGLFKIFDGGVEGDFWQVFDPPIRDSSYMVRLNSLFELLEKSVGTSRGILTTPEAATTATEIRRSTHDTWVLVDNTRKAIVRMMNDLVYIYDALCNYYSLSPAGAWEMSFDWDYSLLENTAETFSQLMQAQSVGAVSSVDIRQFVKPDETAVEAEKAVREIESANAQIQNMNYEPSE